MEPDEIKKELEAGGYEGVSAGEIDKEGRGWWLFTAKKAGRNYLLRCNEDGRMERFVEELMQ